MTTVRLDTVQDIECEELYGNVQRLVRKAYVLGLTATDYTSLFDAMEDAGIPAPGSSVAAAPNCVLTRRSARMIDNDKAEVTMTYEYALNEGYNMDSPPFGVIFGEGSCAVDQKPSNVDVDGNPVSVDHTWPSTDPDYGSAVPPPPPQGGKFDYFAPKTTLKFQGLKSNDTPGATARSMLGHVNGDTWNGGVEGTWLCVAANYKLFDQASSPARYFWVLEFNYDPDGWDPDIIYVDDRTGKPPEGLVDGIGFKKVRKYPEVDFDIAFGATLVGE